VARHKFLDRNRDEGRGKIFSPVTTLAESREVRTESVVKKMYGKIGFTSTNLLVRKGERVTAA